MNDGQNDKNRGDDDPMARIGEPFDDLEYIGQSPQWVSKLNARYALMTSEGGKARVLVQTTSEVSGRVIPRLISAESFRLIENNGVVEVGTDKNGNPKYAEAGSAWLKHPHRRTLSEFRFDPSTTEKLLASSVPGQAPYLNLWNGFGVEATKGDWSLLDQHVREVLADGVEDYYSYIIRWCAWVLQNPDKVPEVALVFRGNKGAGKGTIGRALARIFGDHGLHLSSAGLLTGRFNEHYRFTAFVFADEAIHRGDKAAAAKLQTMITEDTLVIEGKGEKVVQTVNRLSILMAAEDGWNIPAGPYERRYGVFDVSARRRGDRAYFKALNAQMENGGLEAMLHDLLGMDLGGWHPREDVPQTAALARQKELSMSYVDEFVADLLEDGVLPADAPRKDAPHGAVSAENLWTVMKERVPGLKDWSAQKLAGELLATWGVEKGRVGRDRVRVFPPLADMRATFSERYGARVWVDGPDAKWAYHKELPF
jgi:hypothetical protein